MKFDFAHLLLELGKIVGADSGLNEIIDVELDVGIARVDAKSKPNKVLVGQAIDTRVKADCVIKSSLETINGLIDGSVNPGLALAFGQISVEGDVGAAERFGAYLQSHAANG